MIGYQSINQQNASLAEREELYRKMDRAQTAAVTLQTCNRVEVYYGEGGVPDEVARHLFRVTSGLESALIGERAVQGQVKEAYQTAIRRTHLSAEMHKLFEYALQTGKRVRSETEISQGAVSHSLAAIEILEREGVDLSRARITIIGVNKLTGDILRFLKNKGARMVFLANRSQAKAHQIADPIGIGVYDLKDKRAFLRETDVLITATSAPHSIIGAEDIEDGQKIVAIDLAFPRDIDPEVYTKPNVRLYNIRDVEDRVRDNIRVRESEVERAEAIIEEEIGELRDTLNRRNKYRARAV